MSERSERAPSREAPVRGRVNPKVTPSAEAHDSAEASRWTRIADHVFVEMPEGLTAMLMMAVREIHDRITGPFSAEVPRG